MKLGEQYRSNLLTRKSQGTDKINGAIYDDSILPVGTDTDGKKCDNMELHETILKLIREFDRVCRKNDIPYALGFGSALGINNYKGFIPWDDDADVVIKYEDINRVVEACKKDLGEDFTLDCYENNPRYNVLIPTMKLRIKNTYCKEPNDITLPNRCKNGEGVFMDIVCFMGVPEDEKTYIKALKYAKHRWPLYVFLDGLLRIHPMWLKRKLKKFEKETYEKYKDSKMVSQTVIIPWQNWAKCVDKLAFPREMIFPFREYDFEGEKFYSFNDVEGFCRYRYGEVSLKEWDGEKWIDNYPLKERKIRHLAHFNLYHDKKVKKK